jgi:DNA-binding transcriptional LysR family regulator
VISRIIGIVHEITCSLGRAVFTAVRAVARRRDCQSFKTYARPIVPKSDQKNSTCGPLVALVPLSHGWAKERSISLRKLPTALIVIGTASRWPGFRLFVDEMTAAKGLKLNIVEDADDLPVLLQLVRSGFGCTILDASFIPTLPPGIKALEIEDIAPTLDIALAWREDSVTSLVPRFCRSGGTSNTQSWARTASVD